MAINVAFNPPQFIDRYEGYKMRQLVDELDRLHAALTRDVDEEGIPSTVDSFNGRFGDIIPEQADYDSFFLTPAEGDAAYAAIGNVVNSFNGRQGAVVPTLGDYAALAETFTARQTFQGGLHVSNAQPKQVFTDTDAILDEKNYLFRSQGGQFGLHTATDAAPETIVDAVFTAQRLGTDVTSVDIPSALTAVSYGGVLEANLLDKTAPETVSGSYTFSGTPFFTSTLGPRLANNVALRSINNLGTLNVNVAYLSTADTLQVGEAGYPINLLANTDIAGNLTLTGTVDGRDVALDGTNQDAHLALVNEHIDWTNATQNLVTSGDITANLATTGIGTIQVGESTNVSEQRFRLQVSGRQVDLVMSGNGASYGLYDRTDTRWALQLTEATSIGTLYGSQLLTAGNYTGLVNHDLLTGFVANEHLDWTLDQGANNINDANILASSITQHQAALTILESQITDGTILARLAGNETVTGNWTFNIDTIGDVIFDRQSLTGASGVGFANDDGIKGYIGFDDAGGFTIYNAATTPLAVLNSVGDLQIDGDLHAAGGAAAAPGLSFFSETNSGFYRPGAGRIGVSVLGGLKGEWNADGLDVIRLDVDGKKFMDMPSNSTERGPWNPLITSIMASGRILYGNPEFSGATPQYNGILVYDNASTGTITTAHGNASVLDPGFAAPNSNGLIVEISWDGTLDPTPNDGGWRQNWTAEENHTFVWVFLAKLTSGATLNINNNSQGANPTLYWLTDNVGTGKYEYYAMVGHCGDSGTFSTGGFTSVDNGGVAWTVQIAWSDVIDVTENPDFARYSDAAPIWENPIYLPASTSAEPSMYIPSGAPYTAGSGGAVWVIAGGTPATDHFYVRIGGNQYDLTAGADTESLETINGLWTFATAPDFNANPTAFRLLTPNSSTTDAKFAVLDDTKTFTYGSMGWDAGEQAMGITSGLSGNVGMFVGAGLGGSILLDNQGTGGFIDFLGGNDIRVRDGAEMFFYSPANTEFAVAGHNGTFFELGTAAGDGPTYLTHQGTNFIRSQTGTTAGNTAWGVIRHRDGSYYDIGMNVVPKVDQNVNTNFTATLASKMLHKSSGLALDFTVINSTDMPNGTMWFVHNDDAEDLDIIQGTGCTLYWLEAGAAPVAGTFQVLQGGIITVYKVSATEYWAWGSREAGATAIANVVEDTTPQLGGDLDLNGNDILSSLGTGKLTSTTAVGSMRLTNDAGTTWADIGPRNSTYVHLETNASSGFYSYDIFTFSAGARFLDSDVLSFGTSQDIQLKWDGVDMEVDSILAGAVWRFRDGQHLIFHDSTNLDTADFQHNGTDFDMTFSGTRHIDMTGHTGYLRLSGSILLGEATAAEADLAGYGQYWVLNTAPNDPMFTGDTGLDYFLGFGSYRRSAATTLDHGTQSINMNTAAISRSMVNGVWWRNDATTTTYTLTLEASATTNFPVGGQITVYNANTSTGAMNIAGNTGALLRILDGSAVVNAVGAVTLESGGYCTIIRESTTTWRIMGAGLTP